MATLIRVGDTNYPVWMSTSQAAEVLGVHEDTCRVWCRQGRLPIMRRTNEGQAYRVITGQLFSQMGVRYKTVTEKVPA